MKHEPIITFDRASCSCGRMPGIIRPASEPVGAFTKRAKLAHETHVELARPAIQGGLFDAQMEMFGEVSRAS
jgi:hypothetical protein